MELKYAGDEIGILSFHIYIRIMIYYLTHSHVMIALSSYHHQTQVHVYDH